MFEILICAFYAWYFLPVIGTVFSASYYNYIFIGLFIIGWFGICFIKRKGKLSHNKLYYVIALYLIPIVIMGVIGIGDASKTIRINSLFFLTAVLYGLTKDQKSEKQIAYFFIISFLITAVTSLIGLLAIPSAARAISRAHADQDLQTNYKLLNIAGSFFYQALVMMVAPILAVAELFNKKIVGYIGVGFILLILLNASFSIAIIGLCLAILCFVILNTKANRKKKLSIITITLLSFLIILFRFESILLFVGEHIKSSYISDRLRDIAYAYKMGVSSLSKTSDVALRMNHYSSSIETFIKNPFGIGPYYSYVAMDKGIGYHSQILDDMARYGIASIIFYIIFFKQYYRMLAEQWDKIHRRDVAKICTIIYFFFLLMNIGFRSGAESVMCFYILPAIPNILLHNQYSRNKCHRHIVDIA